MIYIASPYTHPDPAVRRSRYEAVMHYVQWHFTCQPDYPFSPILYTHELAVRHGLPHDAAWWLEHNAALMDKCEKVFVLTLDGWRDSVGVQHEIEWAVKNEAPLYHVTPDYGSYIIHLSHEK